GCTASAGNSSTSASMTARGWRTPRCCVTNTGPPSRPSCGARWRGSSGAVCVSSGCSPTMAWATGRTCSPPPAARGGSTIAGRDLDQPEADQLLEEIRRSGGDVVGVELDIPDALKVRWEVKPLLLEDHDPIPVRE